MNSNEIIKKNITHLMDLKGLKSPDLERLISDKGGSITRSYIWKLTDPKIEALNISVDKLDLLSKALDCTAANLITENFFKSAQTIGERISIYRKKSHLSQGQLGSMVGLTQQAIANIEQRDSPPKNIIKFSQALKVPIETLLGKSVVEENLEQSSSSYSIKAIREIVPVSIKKTITSLNSKLAKSGGGITVLPNEQYYFEQLLYASLLSELSGDYGELSGVLSELDKIGDK